VQVTVDFHNVKFVFDHLKEELTLQEGICGWQVIRHLIGILHHLILNSVFEQDKLQHSLHSQDTGTCLCNYAAALNVCKLLASPKRV